jgi:membrane-associated phospholipid phosphatase
MTDSQMPVNMRRGPIVSRRGLRQAYQRVWPVMVVAAAFVGLLIQSHSRLPRWVYPVLFALPLALAMWRRDAKALRLWGVYVVSFVAFSMVRVAADTMGFPVRETYVATLDQWIGLGVAPTITLQARLPTSGAIVWSAVLVHLSYYAVPPLAGIGCWLRSPERFSRYAWGFAGVYATSLLLHIIVPTVPPWLAGIHGTLPPVRRLINEAINGWNPAVYQYGLYVAAGNDVAAMPSVHAAASAMVALALWPSRWRWLGVAYVFMMGTALVYLGEHYLVDIVAGVLIALCAWHLAGRATGGASGHSAYRTPTSRSGR